MIRSGEKYRQFCQLLLVTLLYLIPSVQALLPVDDPDIWWHLRTGQWILQEGAIPTTDSFSSYGEGKPWVAYSWLFEVIIYAVYSAFGLVGIVYFTVFFGLLIALALHALVRRARLPFLQETIITGIALICMKPAMIPRPWLFGILFFIVELHIIFRFRGTGNRRLLYWLPAIFVVWANTHIQFVYGLAILIFVAAEPFLHRVKELYLKTDNSEFPFSRELPIVTGVCLFATLINPYHLFLYQPIVTYATQTSIFQNIRELHPLLFRNPLDWIYLGLMLAATFSLGWRRETRLFPFFLLLLGAALSFRAQRDVWVGAVAAAVVLSEWRITGFPTDRLQITPTRIVLIACAVGATLFLFAHARNITDRGLEAHVAKIFPVDAVAFVKKHDLPGPLYNNLDWGGFLIWSLPDLKVSMDGRANLHGEERIERGLAVWSGRPGWESDRELARAELIITPVAQPLTGLLRSDSRFRLVYEDERAAVFTRPSGTGGRR